MKVATYKNCGLLLDLAFKPTTANGSILRWIYSVSVPNSAFKYTTILVF